MRRAAIAAAALALGAAAPASAKTGLEWNSYPDEAQVGQPVAFTLHMFRGGGAAPLLAFKSRSGRVVRVRVGPADRFGVAHGSVAFPDKGPWIMTFHVKSHGVWIGNEDPQPIHVGIGLTQTTPLATPPKTVDRPAGGSVPWVWILSLASIGSALFVLVMRRRGRWGAA